MYQVMPTLNNKFPCEGPRVIPYFMDFATANEFNLDMKTLVQQGKISEVQSIYVDNSGNDKSLVIKVAVQNQTIIIPPYSQAYLAILASVAQLVITSQSPTAIVGVFVQNFPVSNCVWNANSNSTPQSVNVSNFPVVQPVIVSTTDSFAFAASTTGANLSVSTVSTSTAITATGGQNIRLCNTGSETVFIRLTAGSSTATVNDMALIGGESIILNVTGINTLSAICLANTSTLNYVIGNGGI